MTLNGILLESEKDSSLDHIIELYISLFPSGIFESKIQPNKNILDSEFYNIELPESPQKGRRLDPEYFQREAMQMRGVFSEDLARALEAFQEGITDSDFGTTFLRGFVKQDRDVPEEELRKYALGLDVRFDGSGYGNVFRQYFDAVFNFCLTYNGELIASVGFNPEEGRMVIQQIQGVRGKAERLKPIKWERALVNYAAQWAESYGIPEVVIVSVDNNSWVKKEGLQYDRGKMLYDVTARRCGFKRTEDGNYVRQAAVPEPVVD